MIIKAEFAPDTELTISITNIKGGWRPKRLSAFGALHPFQDLGIVATGIDANGEYARLLLVVRSGEWRISVIGLC